jgi:hypothetical protein
MIPLFIECRLTGVQHLQTLFDHHGVVPFFIFGAEDQGDASSPGSLGQPAELFPVALQLHFVFLDRAIVFRSAFDRTMTMAMATRIPPHKAKRLHFLSWARSRCRIRLYQDLFTDKSCDETIE